MEAWQVIGLPSIVVLGVLAQWLAWRWRLPAILLLLVFGMLAGPGTAMLADAGWAPGRLLDPDLLFGGLLLPLVSLFVAVILFEGGLTLSLSELGASRRVVFNLVSVGALWTWVIATAGAWAFVGLPLQLALLLGALLVVTGPTVIGPLLRHVRPTGKVGPILKWEGIVIDPIGVLLTLIVFESIPEEGIRGVTRLVVWGVAKTVVVGTGLGLAGAGLLMVMLRRYWVPDYLQIPATLAVVVAAFAGANVMQHEAGLFAVTVMGIVLANQKRVQVKHILEFKENLTVLLVSSLFIILAARLRLHDLRQMGWGVVGFLAVLIFVARPVAVLASTRKSGLGWREKVFLMCMAPRGIVAASVSSVFALRLQQAGYEEGPRFVPIVFTVIIGTVAFYGLVARHAARKLGLAKPGRRDYLIAGANPVARAVAGALLREKHEVLLVDTNRENLAAARKEGLPIYYASILSENVAQRVELSGFGRLLALTPNEEVNSLAAVRFARMWGRSEAYQLSPGPEAGRREKVLAELRGRPLFGPGVTFAKLLDWIEAGATVERVALRGEYDYRKFQQEHGEGAVVLFVVSEDGSVEPVTTEGGVGPRVGQAVLALVKGKREEGGRMGAGIRRPKPEGRRNDEVRMTE